MGKRRKGIYLRKDDKIYKIATLFWNEEKEDIYLTLNRPASRESGSLGLFTVLSNGKAIVDLEQGVVDTDVLHSSVHARGRQHVTVADESSPHQDVQHGIPLKNLSNARALWTLYPRLYSEAIVENAGKASDFIIEEPANIKGRAFYLIAVPHGNLELNLETMVNDDGSLPDMGYFVFELPHYNILLLAYCNDKMVEADRTLKFPAPNGLLAWIESSTTKKIIIQLVPLIPGRSSAIVASAAQP